MVWISIWPQPNVTVGTPLTAIQLASSPPLEISVRGVSPTALTASIAAAGASVLEVVHDRTFSGPDVFSVTVDVTVQTADRDHVRALGDRLLDDGFEIAAVTAGGPRREDGSPR